MPLKTSTAVAAASDLHIVHGVYTVLPRKLNSWRVFPLLHQLQKHQNNTQLQGINRHHNMHLTFKSIYCPGYGYVHVSSTFIQYALGLEGLEK